MSKLAEAALLIKLVKDDNSISSGFAKGMTLSQNYLQACKDCLLSTPPEDFM
jgi:hypothetical protein